MTVRPPGIPDVEATGGPVSRRRLVTGILLVVVVLGSLLALGTWPRVARARQLVAAAARQQGVPTVTAVKATRAPAETEVRLPGTVQSLAETAVYARADGYVGRLLADLGDRVQRGQVLAEIDSPELDQQMSEADATLQRAQAGLRQAEAAASQSQANLRLAELTARRWLTRRDFPDYSLALQLSLPLLNRAAQADYARDAVALQQQELRLRQLEKQVYVEIENARLAVEQAGASLAVAEREREFQEQALAAEEEKLGIGASTTYLVIQYQRDLAQARAAGVAARSEYLKARAALQRAAGMLLDAYGITVAGTDIHHR